MIFDFRLNHSQGNKPMEKFCTQLKEVSKWLDEFTLIQLTKDEHSVRGLSNFIKRQKEQSSQLQQRSHQVQGMLGALKILQEAVPTESEEVIKRLGTLACTSEEAMDKSNCYLKFLRLVEDLTQEMDRASKSGLESSRPNIQQLYLQVCNSSKTCLARHHRDEFEVRQNIDRLMEAINIRQSELIAAWSSAKQRESQVKAEARAKAEQVLEDLRLSWGHFDPLIRLNGAVEPSHLVSSLESSYDILSRLRSTLHRLDGAALAVIDDDSFTASVSEHKIRSRVLLNSKAYCLLTICIFPAGDLDCFGGCVSVHHQFREKIGHS